MSCSCVYPDARTEGNTYAPFRNPYTTSKQWYRMDSAWQPEALRKLQNLRSWKKWDRQNGNKIPWHIYGPLFHDPCDSCNSVQSKIDKQIFCSTCLHNRVRHLLLCAPVWKNIPLGSVNSLLERQKCLFCRIVTQSIQRHWRCGEIDKIRARNIDCILRCVENRSYGPCLRLSFVSESKQTIQGLEHKALIRLHLLCPEQSPMPDYNITEYIYSDDELLYSPFKSAQEQAADSAQEWPVDSVRELAVDSSKNLALTWKEQSEDLDLLHESKREVFINEITPHPVRGDSLLFHLVREKVNWVLVQGALRHCVSSHCRCRKLQFNSKQYLKRPTRLIDVVQRTVTMSPSNVPYLCLSYVWGDVKHQKLRALRSNILELGRIGALKDSLLPKTIKDVMKATLYLGERYLWVDALCIIQDDQIALKSEIDAMGEIYSGALLTLVAPTCQHADSGLPGVSTDLRDRQIGGHVADLEIVELLPGMESTVETSLWNTRGWTFQERLLSNRSLYFTSSQVFLRCISGLWSEDPCRDTTVGFGPYEVYRPVNADAPSHPLRDFTVRVSDYNIRSLSQDSDALNAFAGVSQFLSQRFWEQGMYILGLPLPYFETALLWQSVGPSRMRQRSADFSIPSWSWASVQGKIKLESIGATESRRAGVKTLHPYTDTRLMLPAPLINVYICLKEKEGFISLETMRSNADHKSIKAWSRGRPDQYQQVSELYGLTNQSDSEPLIQIEKRDCRYGRLLFQAAASKFNLRPPKESRAPELHWQFHVEVGSVKVLAIHSESGQHVGYIEMNNDWISRALKHGDDAQRFDFVALSACTMPIHWTVELYPVDEYLALGKYDETTRTRLHVLQRYQSNWRGRVPWAASQIIDLFVSEKNGDVLDDDEYYDVYDVEKDSQALPLPYMVNVMLVDWVDGVAKRLGIGKVLLSGWLENETEVKTVILE